MSNKPENLGRSTDDVGYKAKQINEGDLDQAWRLKHGRVQNAAGGADGAADAQARELEEDAKIVDIQRKIKAIMEEDDGPRQGARPSNTGTLRRGPPPNKPAPGLSMGDLMEGLSQEDMARVGMDIATDNAARNLVQQSYTENPDEATMMAESYGRQPQPTNGSWKVQKLAARIKNTEKVVPVWKVLDESTQMSIPKMFRVQEPAQRIATILNQSGNVNDPRINGILQAYDKHVTLMKEVRRTRKLIKEGRNEFNDKLERLLVDLEQVNWKLGI